MKKYHVHTESSLGDYVAGSLIIFGLIMLSVNVVFGLITSVIGGCLFTLNRKAVVNGNHFRIFDSILGVTLFTQKTIDLKELSLIKLHQYSEIEGGTLGRGQALTSRIRIYQVSLYKDNERLATLNHKEYKDAVQTAKELNTISNTAYIDQIKEKLIQNKKAYNERKRNLNSKR